MEEALISVVVPVYNGEMYIERCVNSILNQTYSNIELIVIDDGSVDKTPVIVKEIAEKDEKLKYIWQKNSGVSSARNAGLNNAKGEFLFFVDADDWIDKNMVMENYLLMKSRKYSLIINDFFYNKKERQTISHTFEFMEREVKCSDIKKSLLISDRLNSQCICMYDLSIIKKNNICFVYDLTCGEDNVFNLHYAEYINAAYYTKKAYYHYEIHKDSGCRKLHKNQIEMMEKQNDIKAKLNSKWNVLTKEEFSIWQQLILTHISAYTLIAQRYGKTHMETWLEELYSSNIYRWLCLEYNCEDNETIPKSYRQLGRLIIYKKRNKIFFYCMLLNALISIKE